MKETNKKENNVKSLFYSLKYYLDKNYKYKNQWSLNYSDLYISIKYTIKQLINEELKKKQK